jgi:glutamate-1-semialdehyde aminotransferase
VNGGYSRSGGEAVSIAARIARAFTKRDKVVFCGYHGWHDWYLSENISDGDNLKTHLLPGLSPVGVPKNLEGSSIPFHYNDIDELNKIMSEYTPRNKLGRTRNHRVGIRVPHNPFIA